MSAPEAPQQAPRARERGMPVWLARLIARALRGAGITTSVLLGLASILIAFSAYQATQYGDAATQLDSLANRTSVDNINQAQDDYAQHLLDSQIWVSIIAQGDTVETSPLGTLLSQRWRDALERAAAAGNDYTADGSYLLPLDQRYYDELTIKSRAQLDQMTQAYDAARAADSTSSRITGSSIMYSAALLLLTVATTASRKTGRLALNTAALGIMVVAVIVGWAPPLFG